MSKYDKYIGETYFDLTCAKFVKEGKSATPSKAIYLWNCNCGRTREAAYCHVKHGVISSCKTCVRIAKSTSLGMSNHPFYFIWRSMKWRCQNHENYTNIEYDKKWETFVGFYNDMWSTYFEGASIDRIDNTKGYYKENCQWLTLSEHGKKTAKDIKC